METESWLDWRKFAITHPQKLKIKWSVLDTNGKLTESFNYNFVRKLPRNQLTQLKVVEFLHMCVLIHNPLNDSS